MQTLAVSLHPLPRQPHLQNMLDTIARIWLGSRRSLRVPDDEAMRKSSWRSFRERLSSWAPQPGASGTMAARAARPRERPQDCRLAPLCESVGAAQWRRRAFKSSCSASPTAWQRGAAGGWRGREAGEAAACGAETPRTEWGRAGCSGAHAANVPSYASALVWQPQHAQRRCGWRCAYLRYRSQRAAPSGQPMSMVSEKRWAPTVSGVLKDACASN